MRGRHSKGSKIPTATTNESNGYQRNENSFSSSPNAGSWLEAIFELNVDGTVVPPLTSGIRVDD